METSGGTISAGIVGAGIAGLSAAIGLRRAGHQVEIFEKSQFKYEVGAAVTVGCNGTRVLERWGLDFDKWGATENCQDLHTGLRELAEGGNGDGHPAKINLGCEVVDLDADEGIITLASGKTVKKDLIIVADGIRTRLLHNVVPNPSPTQKTGHSIFRCLLPMSAALADPLIAPLFQDQPTGLLGPNVPGHYNLCGSYPCRRGEVLNLIYVFPSSGNMLEADSWNTEASIADVEKVTGEFHPAIQKLPTMATDIKAYNMMIREEIPTFVKGRALVIGDAAHPMLTSHAQGASISIETTGALPLFFPSSLSSANIPKRLELFNQFRHPREVATQLLSNTPPHLWMQNPEAYDVMVTKIRRYYDGKLPPRTSKPWGPELRDWFFGYDVFEEGQKLLKGQDNGEFGVASREMR